jgi:hypothetical protein
MANEPNPIRNFTGANRDNRAGTKSHEQGTWSRRKNDFGPDSSRQVPNAPDSSRPALIERELSGARKTDDRELSGVNGRCDNSTKADVESRNWGKLWILFFLLASLGVA